MVQRIITGAFIALLMIVLVVFSGTWFFPFIMTLIVMLGAYEMLCCIGTVKNLFLSIPSLAAAAVSGLCAYFFGYTSCLAVVLMYITLLLAFCVFFEEKVHVKDALCTFGSCFYVILCFSALIAIRQAENVGLYMFLSVFIAAWVTDTFAYFVGVFFGKHKLIPKISPKKTVEGSLGGVVFCIAAFAIYGYILNGIFDADAKLIVFMAAGFVMSLISQLGDLIASAIKRSCGIKDYGTIFPGHGGILDRFDSIMILSPFLLFATENISFFG